MLFFVNFFPVRPSHFTGVSKHSFSLCCNLLSRVCHTAVTHCKDALENHLHVIVGTLIPLVDYPEVQEQVLDLLKYLVIDNKDNENLFVTIKLLDPFPDHVVFKNLRLTQQKIKYSGGPFSLSEEINHFLSVSAYNPLPLTRLEGLKDLRRQLEEHKDQMLDLMRASQGTIYFYVNGCFACTYICAPHNFSAYGDQKKVLDSSGTWVKRWLWAVIYVLRTEPGSSARAAIALNRWAISPAASGILTLWIFSLFLQMFFCIFFLFKLPPSSLIFTSLQRGHCIVCS